jgi:hypothetical protein
MNQYLDQRLRPLLDYYQDTWSEALPALDAVQAALPHESLGGLSPHEVVLGFKAPLHFDWEARTTDWENIPRLEKLNRQEAQKRLDLLKGYHNAAQKGVQKAQQVMAEQANRRRREIDFGVGDRVFIIKKNWSTHRPGDKLDYVFTRRHYKILEKLGENAFVLELPDD